MAERNSRVIELSHRKDRKEHELRKHLVSRVTQTVLLLDLENLDDAYEYVRWLLETQGQYHQTWGAQQGQAPESGDAS